MLMRPYDGGIDHGVLVVGILGQRLENALPDAARAPARVARMNHAEIAEAFRQVPPRNAGTVALQHRFDKQAIVRCRSASMAFSTGEPILDPLPLVVP